MFKQYRVYRWEDDDLQITHSSPEYKVTLCLKEKAISSTIYNPIPLL